MKELIDIVLHLDKHLEAITAQYGTTTYAILFIIVFCETGLVVTPFLPGDSLLFAAGAVSSLGTLNPWVLALGIMASALVGDNVNYQLGKALGPRVMKGEKSRIFNKKHLEKTKKFYEKYGGKTIIIARFVPIVRTFAPFVAGAGAMNFKRFIGYSIGGAILWVTVLFGAGYMFGGNPIVKKNFSIVVFAIIFISILPGIIEFVKARRAKKSDDEETAEA
jgi:membrane-associated protein